MLREAFLLLRRSREERTVSLHVRLFAFFSLFILILAGTIFLVLTLTGVFNTDRPELMIPLSKEWTQRHQLQGRIKHYFFLESPVPEDSPWFTLGLIHAVWVPLIDYEQTCRGMILGGVSKSREAVYDFHPKEIVSSFMVYSQQMNGIYNSLAAMALAKEALGGQVRHRNRSVSRTEWIKGAPLAADATGMAPGKVGPAGTCKPQMRIEKSECRLPIDPSILSNERS